MTIDLPRVHSGKVRELYDAGQDRLLLVASDRVSAFDVIMAEPIPHKGRVLTAMTCFWFEELADVVPSALLTADPVAIEAALGAALQAQAVCLELYRRAAARAAAAGFILADTKFELGYVDGTLCLCDEVCTPDSSRLWPADEVVPGTTPPAFDKQPLRDWLAAQPWDRKPPPPPLPTEVTEAMSARYVAAYERVSGRALRDWYGAAE